MSEYAHHFARLEALVNQTRDELAEVRHDLEELPGDHAAQAKEMDRLTDRVRRLQQAADEEEDRRHEGVLLDVERAEAKLLLEAGSIMCAECGHPYSSHTFATPLMPCSEDGCSCDCFESAEAEAVP